MTLYEMTRTYGEGKGESMMWMTVELISEAIEKSMDEKAKQDLMKKIYGKMSGGHYDEAYAMHDTAKMSYKDRTGTRHSAPYWTEQQVREVYDKVDSQIPDYNFWDFFVALNMTKSDYCPLMDKWFPGIPQEERDARLVEMTLNWLKDEDSPYGTAKVWGYLNPTPSAEK